MKVAGTQHITPLPVRERFVTTAYMKMPNALVSHSHTITTCKLLIKVLQFSHSHLVQCWCRSFRDTKVKWSHAISCSLWNGDKCSSCLVRHTSKPGTNAAVHLSLCLFLLWPHSVLTGTHMSIHTPWYHEYLFCPGTQIPLSHTMLPLFALTEQWDATVCSQILEIKLHFWANPGECLEQWQQIEGDCSMCLQCSWSICFKKTI